MVVVTEVEEQSVDGRSGGGEACDHYDMEAGHTDGKVGGEQGAEDLSLEERTSPVILLL